MRHVMIASLIAIASLTPRADEPTSISVNDAYAQAKQHDEAQAFAEAGALYHRTLMDPEASAEMRRESVTGALRSFHRVRDEQSARRVVADILRLPRAPIDLRPTAIEALTAASVAEPYVYEFRTWGYFPIRRNWRFNMDIIIVPKIDMDKRPLDEVVAHLQTRSRDLDPDGQGATFLLLTDQPAAELPRLSMSLSEVPLSRAAEMVAAQADYRLVRLSEHLYAYYQPGYFGDDPRDRPAWSVYHTSHYDTGNRPWLDRPTATCRVQLWSCPTGERGDLDRGMMWQPAQALARLRIAGGFLGEADVATNGDEPAEFCVDAPMPQGAAHCRVAGHLTVRTDPASGQAICEGQLRTAIGDLPALASPRPLSALLPWGEERLVRLAFGRDGSPDIYVVLSPSQPAGAQP